MRCCTAMCCGETRALVVDGDEPVTVSCDAGSHLHRHHQQQRWSARWYRVGAGHAAGDDGELVSGGGSLVLDAGRRADAAAAGAAVYLCIVDITDHRAANSSSARLLAANISVTAPCTYHVPLTDTEHGSEHAHTHI